MTPPPALETDRTVDGKIVYAVGDIHGRYDLLRQMLGLIVEDYGTQARGRRLTLILCGDYIDRGPESADVLEALVWLTRRPEFHVRLLKGNHEQGLLDFLDRPEDGGPWLRYGGTRTLASYRIDPPAPDAKAAKLVKARDALLDRMPASHLHLLGALELSVTIGDYLFVHAGIRPGVALADQAEDDLLWIRDEFLEKDMRHDHFVIHGHSWIDDQPSIRPHRIGIDTGAYATGVLTAVRLEDGSATILRAAGTPDPAADDRHGAEAAEG
ncbi:metallophosphoesterase family protein [Sphingomonas naphthae]|uniref:Metallophosphoesterase family protein n=1 Tax=Sphingomonas naphthae TaxID=1813468 RepID=A0ABY7TPS9_9SPHN|nr:metallophosphoesterase family protein [Sphingomonas naphthae]WCT75241.1 metallophosphoesterase family protein [Sphingomonas naphthae]